MDDLLINTLESLGYPVFLQGSLNDDQVYPASFFTFWNTDAPAVSFYNNSESAIEWAYDVNFYSNDPELVNTKLLEAKKLLKQAGFICTGGGHSVMSDEITHTGRGIDVYYRD